MRTFIMTVLLALILVGCGGQTSGSTTISSPPTGAPTLIPATPTTDQAGVEIKPMPIDSFEVQIRESAPVQVAVLVNGTLSDGCTTFNAAKQTRNGSTIELEITVQRTKAAMCTQMLGIYRESIALVGDFPSGDYIVRVNGIEKAFKI